MIQRPCLSPTLPSWQAQLANAITDPDQLIHYLALPDDYLEPARQAAKLFPLRVPYAFVDRMKQGDANDPLLRQVLPLHFELVDKKEYVIDPVGDAAATRGPGILHKYRGRVLLIATGACAVHCRYCFRRHFPYHESQASKDSWHDAIHYISNHHDIEEVILSGGDPLSLSERRLQHLTDRLNEIPHVRQLRIHTRLPAVIPARIDSQFLEWMKTIRQQVVCILHINHANEIDHTLEEAVKKLRNAHVNVLNQAVLLRGINDSDHALRTLHRTLFEAGIIPYYLHLLDRVHGAAHFNVADSLAKSLHKTLRETLPGYMVPRLVREIAGAPYKVPVTPL